MNAGDRFWRWTVLGETTRGSGGLKLLCRCDCGVERFVRARGLRGGSRSCGCLALDEQRGRAVRGDLTHARLLALLRYEPETGEFFWRVDRISKKVAGDRAGSCGVDGYRSITIDCRRYRENRLAHFYMVGAWPLRQVDHRDGDIANNRWLNLRVASQSQNSANRGPTRKNKSGFKGVSPHEGGKWIATICVNYEKKYLGLHETREQAAAAYAAAAAAYFGEFARTVKGERAARRDSTAALPTAPTSL